MASRILGGITQPSNLIVGLVETTARRSSSHNTKRKRMDGDDVQRKGPNADEDASGSHNLVSNYVPISADDSGSLNVEPPQQANHDRPNESPPGSMIAAPDRSSESCCDEPNGPPSQPKHHEAEKRSHHDSSNQAPSTELNGEGKHEISIEISENESQTENDGTIISNPGIHSVRQTPQQANQGDSGYNQRNESPIAPDRSSESCCDEPNGPPSQLKHHEAEKRSHHDSSNQAPSTELNGEGKHEISIEISENESQTENDGTIISNPGIHSVRQTPQQANQGDSGYNQRNESPIAPDRSSESCCDEPNGPPSQPKHHEAEKRSHHDSSNQAPSTELNGEGKHEISIEISENESQTENDDTIISNPGSNDNTEAETDIAKLIEGIEEGEKLLEHEKLKAKEEDEYMLLMHKRQLEEMNIHSMMLLNELKFQKVKELKEAKKEAEKELELHKKMLNKTKKNEIINILKGTKY